MCRRIFAASAAPWEISSARSTPSTVTSDEADAAGEVAVRQLGAGEPCNAAAHNPLVSGPAALQARHINSREASSHLAPQAASPAWPRQQEQRMERRPRRRRQRHQAAAGSGYAVPFWGGRSPCGAAPALFLHPAERPGWEERSQQTAVASSCPHCRCTAGATGTRFTGGWACTPCFKTAMSYHATASWLATRSVGMQGWMPIRPHLSLHPLYTPAC